MVWLILLGSVAVLGGIIAYAGDMVGRRVGRKHMRLFGLRPKTTGLIFAIGSGVLVALLSVGTVALIARDTVENVSRAQEIRRERDDTRRDLENLNTEYKDTQESLVRASEKQKALEAQLRTSQATLKDKLRELEQAASFTGRLRDKSTQLEASSRTFKNQIATLDGTVATLQGDIRTLETQRGALNRTRANLTGTIAELRQKRKQLDARLAQQNDKLETLQARIREVSAEKATVQTLYNNAVAQLQPTRARLAKLEAQVRDAENARTAVKAEVTALKTEIGSLKGEIGDLQAEVGDLAQVRTELEADNSKLRTQNTELEKNLAARDADLREVQAALIEARAGNYIYRRGELITQAVLPDAPAEEVRNRLRTVLRQAGQIAEARGAARKPPVLGLNNDLEPYVAKAVKIGGPDLILVRSGRNLPRGMEVPVTLEVLSNKTLYLANQPIRSRELTLGSSDQPRAPTDVQNQLQSLVREVVSDLRDKGIPSENLPAQAISEDEIALFTSRLQRLSGTAWVSIASRQDVAASGPLRFYFDILRAGP